MPRRMDEERIVQIEESVSHFIEQYQELAYDPESTASAVGRILQMGAPLACKLAEACSQASADTVAASDRLTAALKDASVSPQELQSREREFQAARADYDRLNAATDRLLDFKEGVVAVYLSLLDEDGLAFMEDYTSTIGHEPSDVPQSAPEPEPEIAHTPWWKRLIS